MADIKQLPTSSNAYAMQVYDETEPDSADKPVLGEKGRRYSKVNWMKGAFLSADKLLTVSPTYAEEIAANESQGVELDHVIRYCGLEPADLPTIGAPCCSVPAMHSTLCCANLVGRQAQRFQQRRCKLL